MTIFESFLSSRAFGREIELPLLSELAKAVVVVLALYFTVRIQDLMNRDALHYVFEPSYQSIMFIGEIVLGVLVPFALLLFEKVRTSKSRTVLFIGSCAAWVRCSQNEHCDHEHGTVADAHIHSLMAGAIHHARTHRVRICRVLICCQVL